MINPLKKATAILVLLIICSTLSGCFKGEEVSDRIFVQQIGIDKDGSDFQVTFNLFLSKDSGNDDEPTNTIIQRGKTITEAISNVENSQPKKIFLGHCKMIIIGTSVKDLNKDIDFFITNNSISPSTKIVYTNGDAKEIIDLLNNSNASDKVLKMLQNAAQSGKIISNDIVNYFGIQNSQGETSVLPLAAKSDDGVNFSGCSVIKNGEKQCDLSELETRSLGLMKGKVKSFTDTVNCFDTECAIAVDRSSVKTTSRLDNGQLIIKKQISIAGRLTEESPKSNITDMKLIEQSFANEISIGCYSAIDKSKTFKLDLFEVEKLLKKNYSSYFMANQNNFDNILSNTKYEIQVKCIIQNQKKF